jgi:hypothetical protein
VAFFYARRGIGGLNTFQMTEAAFNALQFTAGDRVEIRFNSGDVKTVELQQGRALAAQQFRNPKTGSNDVLPACLVYVGDDPSGEIIELGRIESIRKI